MTLRIYTKTHLKNIKNSLYIIYIYIVRYTNRGQQYVFVYKGIINLHDI